MSRYFWWREFGEYLVEDYANAPTTTLANLQDLLSGKIIHGKGGKKLIKLKFGEYLVEVFVNAPTHQLGKSTRFSQVKSSVVKNL